MEPEAAREFPEAREATGADADTEVDGQDKTKRQRPTPWLPDKADDFEPSWDWSASVESNRSPKPMLHVKTSP